MVPRKRKPPKPPTSDAWKKKHQSLVFDENDLMHCKLCVKWETKMVSCENFLSSFINGSSNYCLSNIESHFNSMMYLNSCRERTGTSRKAWGQLQTE